MKLPNYHTLAWIFILIAAAFEAAWTFSLKLMKFSELKALRWNTFYNPHTGLPVMLPFIGYIFFGIGNIYFFSAAIKTLPTATAYAVWTAVTLVLIKLGELTLYKQRVSLSEVFFMFVIMTGIFGLKFFSK